MDLPALLIAGALLAACTPTQVVRLEGDPPEAAPLTTAYEALHPAADGVRRFVEAAQRGAWEQAWAGLSASTRTALTLRGKAIGVGGIELLRPLPADADVGLRRLHVGDALAAFALAGADGYAVASSPWPVEQAYDGRRLEARVQIAASKAAGGPRAREVVVAFEGAGWRIHDPALAGLPALEAQP